MRRRGKGGRVGCGVPIVYRVERQSFDWMRPPIDMDKNEQDRTNNAFATEYREQRRWPKYTTYVTDLVYVV